jgi:hypothetical protein
VSFKTKPDSSRAARQGHGQPPVAHVARIQVLHSDRLRQLAQIHGLDHPAPVSSVMSTHSRHSACCDDDERKKEWFTFIPTLIRRPLGFCVCQASCLSLGAPQMPHGSGTAKTGAERRSKAGTECQGHERGRDQTGRERDAEAQSGNSQGGIDRPHRWVQESGVPGKWVLVQWRVFAGLGAEFLFLPLPVPRA